MSVHWVAGLPTHGECFLNHALCLLPHCCPITLQMNHLPLQVLCFCPGYLLHQHQLLLLTPARPCSTHSLSLYRLCHSHFIFFFFFVYGECVVFICPVIWITKNEFLTRVLFSFPPPPFFEMQPQTMTQRSLCFRFQSVVHAVTLLVISDTEAPKYLWL